MQTEYIAASRLAASKRQRAFSIGATVTVVVMALLAIVAYLQRGEAVRQREVADERRIEAERQSRIALLRQLAAQAQAMVVQQPKLIGRAGLLAIEAAKLQPSLETDQVLRAVLTTSAQPLGVYKSGALGGQKAYTSVNCLHENR